MTSSDPALISWLWTRGTEHFLMGSTVSVHPNKSHRSITRWLASLTNYRLVIRFMQKLKVLPFTKVNYQQVVFGALTLSPFLPHSLLSPCFRACSTATKHCCSWGWASFRVFPCCIEVSINPLTTIFTIPRMFVLSTSLETTHREYKWISVSYRSTLIMGSV